MLAPQDWSTDSSWSGGTRVAPQTEDGSMTVQSANGPQYRIPRPRPMGSGMQLQTPTSYQAGAPSPTGGAAGGSSNPYAATPTALTTPVTGVAPAAAPTPAPAPTAQPMGDASAYGAAATAPAAPAPVAPAQPAAAPTADPTALQYGARVTPLTGAETPQSITPAPSAALTGLSTSLTGEAQRQLAQPTVYDDPLYQQVTSAEKANVDENFKAQQSQLDGELARRGLDYSSIAGGKLNDIATAHARALSDIDTNTAAQRANDLAAGRTAAFNNASSATGTQAGLEQNYLNNLTNERAYETGQQNTAYEQNLQQTELGLNQSNFQQQQYNNLLSTALGYGQGATGASLMQGAGAALGLGANAYNGQAVNTSNQLGSLAQMLARMNGWGGTSGVGSPGLSVPTGYGSYGAGGYDPSMMGAIPGGYNDPLLGYGG